jgi:hypothetical protein
MDKSIPAFALQILVSPGSKIQKGMTLRDYFANSAMMGIVFRGGLNADNPTWHEDEPMCDAIAANAYIMADAMLAEREKDTTHAKQP